MDLRSGRRVGGLSSGGPARRSSNRRVEGRRRRARARQESAESHHEEHQQLRSSPISPSVSETNLSCKHGVETPDGEEPSAQVRPSATHSPMSFGLTAYLGIFILICLAAFQSLFVGMNFKLFALEALAEVERQFPSISPLFHRANLHGFADDLAPTQHGLSAFMSKHPGYTHSREVRRIIERENPELGNSQGVATTVAIVGPNSALREDILQALASDQGFHTIDGNTWDSNAASWDDWLIQKALAILQQNRRAVILLKNLPRGVSALDPLHHCFSEHNARLTVTDPVTCERAVFVIVLEGAPGDTERTPWELAALCDETTSHGCSEMLRQVYVAPATAPVEPQDRSQHIDPEAMRRRTQFVLPALPA